MHSSAQLSRILHTFIDCFAVDVPEHHGASQAGKLKCHALANPAAGASDQHNVLSSSVSGGMQYVFGCAATPMHIVSYVY